VILNKQKIIFFSLYSNVGLNFTFFIILDTKKYPT